ncbi:MAG: aldo/keto reductase [Candidatus Kapabacteria bacterium]|nr:aldo/keto reductase [Candidatus Kapabacteria bacterium]
MKIKLLGKSGLRVSEVCLGTMTFGDDWGWGAANDESKKIFDIFVNKGGNFVDTANNYTNGTAEKITGDLIRSDRDYFVLATKYTLSKRKNDPNSWGNHKKNMIRSVEASLKNLGTDYIDLYWIHIWDFTTPPEEIMQALDQLVSSGKVLHIGASDTPAWMVSYSNAYSQLMGWHKFDAIQVEYSLLQRTTEYDLIPMANTLKLGILAWAPLAGGVLTGKYNKPDIDSKRAANNQGRLTEKNLKITEEVIKIAEEIGKTPAQVAVNWVKQQSELIIPILGARKSEQIEEVLGANDFILDESHIKRLTEVSRPPNVTPNNMLNNTPMVENLIAGGVKLDGWKIPYY